MDFQIKCFYILCIQAFSTFLELGASQSSNLTKNENEFYHAEQLFLNCLTGFIFSFLGVSKLFLYHEGIFVFQFLFLKIDMYFPFKPIFWAELHMFVKKLKEVTHISLKEKGLPFFNKIKKINRLILYQIS